VVPATAAIIVTAGVIVWHTVIAAPALSFGNHGAVHFEDAAISAGSEPKVCFDEVEWKRICPGQTFADLTPLNVSDRNAKMINLDPHTISTPLSVGKLPPKCRGTKVPGGLAPGVWRLSGHATNICSMWLPLVGEFTVSVVAVMPESLVTIKAAP
jgi:hypothetical protein